MAMLGLRVALAGALVLACLDGSHGDCPAPADVARQREGFASYRAGEESLAAGKWDEAAERFATATRLDPLLSLALYGRGQAHMGAKRYADAVKAFAECREAFRCLASASAADRADVEKRIDDQIRELRGAVRDLDRERLLRASIK